MIRSALIKAALSAVLLFAALLTGAAQGKLAVEGALVDAVADFSAGRYPQAKARLKALAATDPSVDAVWYYLGLTEALMGDPAGIEHVSKAASMDPSNIWYKQRLALLYESEGMDDKVIEIYEDILKTRPEKTDFVYALLSLYIKNREYDKALGAIDELETVVGPDERSVTTRYDILRAQGKRAEAVQALKDYNEKYSSVTVLTALGEHYLTEYDDSLALTSFEEALSIDSSYPPAVIGKAEAYKMSGRSSAYFPYLQKLAGDPTFPAFSKSAYLSNILRNSSPQYIKGHESQFDSIMDAFLESSPSDTLSLSTAGTYFFSTGRTEKGLDLLEKCADAYPSSRDNRLRYLTSLLYANKWEEAHEKAAAAWNDFPEDLGFAEIDNIACNSLKDYDGIVSNCCRMISLHPKDTSVTIPALSMLGDALYQDGRPKEAFKTYKKVLKLRPDYNPVLNNYAYFLSLEGKQLSKAAKMSLKTVQTEPDNATYLDTYGWILHLQGKDAEAKPYFKHAMTHGGKDSATILEHYADVLDALGESSLARAYRSSAQLKK